MYVHRNENGICKMVSRTHYKNSFMKPVENWFDMFKPFDPASFIPINALMCVTYSITINDEVVIAVNPIRKICLFTCAAS